MSSTQTVPPFGLPLAKAGGSLSLKEHYSHKTVNNLMAADIVDFDVRRNKKRNNTEGVYKESSTKHFTPCRTATQVVSALILHG